MVEVIVYGDMAHLDMNVKGQLRDVVEKLFGQHWGRYWATQNGPTFPVYRRHTGSPEFVEAEYPVDGKPFLIKVHIQLEEPREGERI